MSVADASEIIAAALRFIFLAQGVSGESVDGPQRGADYPRGAENPVLGDVKNDRDDRLGSKGVVCQRGRRFGDVVAFVEIVFNSSHVEIDQRKTGFGCSDMTR